MACCTRHFRVTIRAFLIVVLARSVVVVHSQGDVDGRTELAAFFGSKSSYDVAQKYQKVPGKVAPMCAGAEAVSVWALIRHGSRCPTKRRLQSIRRLEGKLGQSATRGPCSAEDAGHLTPEGAVEMYALGERLRGRLQTLLQMPYSHRAYDIRSTHKPRALQSAHAFVTGLFEGTGNLGLHGMQAVAIEGSKTPLLYFHKTCPNYQKHKHVLQQDPLSEVNIFERTRLGEVQARVAKKLQLPDLTMEGLHAAWTACEFGHPTLCAGFSRDDAEMLEFYSDLSNYWLKGHGHPINYEMSVHLVEDLREVLGRALTNDSSRTASLRFAHAETLMPFLSFLGMYKDPEPLRASDSLQRIRKRLWDSSMLPFASNLQITIAKCPGHDMHVVEAMHNEIVVPIPGCGSSTSLCSVRQWHDLLSSELSQHSFDDICTEHSNNDDRTFNATADGILERDDDAQHEQIVDEVIGNIVVGGFTLGLAFAMWSLCAAP